jgi:hypothetical protein
MPADADTLAGALDAGMVAGGVLLCGAVGVALEGGTLGGVVAVVALALAEADALALADAVTVTATLALTLAEADASGSGSA